MQSIEGFIKKHLAEGRIMQIATVSGGQPWVCTVYYIEDDELNLYWLSWPSRRHSQEIARHNKIAIAVPVKLDRPVVGVQAEGTAGVVNDRETIAKIMERYSKRYGAGHRFYNNFVAGKNQHAMYKFVPRKFVLFDEMNFLQSARKEWLPHVDTHSKAL